MTQKIRRALVQDKALSTYAHNLKVIAQGGQVTIKGPVRSDDERKAVEAKVVEVAESTTLSLKSIVNSRGNVASRLEEVDGTRTARSHRNVPPILESVIRQGRLKEPRELEERGALSSPRA